MVSGPELLEMAEGEEWPRFLATLPSADSSALNVKDDDGSTLLHLAANAGRAEVCLAILAHKGFSEVNAKDGHGSTALHDGALSGSAETCRAILRHEGFTQASTTDKDS